MVEGWEVGGWGLAIVFFFFFFFFFWFGGGEMVFWGVFLVGVLVLGG